MITVQRLSGQKRECRLSPNSGKLPKIQDDTFSSEDQKKRERVQNKPTDCKTAFQLSKYIKPDHKRMSRSLGYCLTIGTYDAWTAFTALAAFRLSETERAALAFSALNSLDLDKAEITAAAALGSTGAPMPSFLGGMDEARSWASYASRSELKAYALAAFEAMSAKDRAAFFQHITTKEVAA